MKAFIKWTLEDDLALIRMYGEGKSRAVLATALGRSQCAIVGRLNRLGEDGRIERRKTGRTSTKRATVPAAIYLPAPHVAGPPAPAAQAISADRMKAINTPLEASTPKRSANPEECCWPLGDPKTPEFRFCCAPRVPGKPYCEGHTTMATRTA